MISSENNHLASPNDNSPDGEDSHCGGSVSPSSLRDSQSRASTNEHNNISQHCLHDDTPLSPSLANISTNIELHPQNDALGGSSSHKFIKRPLNAYMIWTRQERKRILTDDPKMKMNEVSKAMGEKWKKMSDKDKKPYFELAKKFSEEHKLVLQEHPELQYAPSKKKAVKKPTDGKQQSLVDSSSVKSCTITPDASRSTTPRGSSSNLITPQPISQSQVFSPFQSPLASSTVQLAQVLQGVRSVTSQAAIVSNASIQNPLLGSASTFPQAFLQSHSLPQRVANSSVSLLGGISHANTTSSTATSTRTTPGQMLDLYYTSLCQPAFPSISENPVNPLGMYPSQYLLEQYNQQLSQQQGSPSASANPNTNGGGRF
ncbi:HMG (high mobility group) box SOX-14 [Globodera pallida]|nr:HMG (high mobility group) box SOX-14 [Globodera pallida]